MSNETERLERDVENRRSTVESTIEELRSRLSVGQIIDELSTYVKDGQGADVAKNLGRQVRDNPLALGLVGAGVAWLLMGQGVRNQAQRLSGGYDGWSDPSDSLSFTGSSGRALSRGSVGYTERYSGLASDDGDFSEGSIAYGDGTLGEGSDAGESREGGGIGSFVGGVGDSLSSATSSVSSAFGSAASGAAGAAKSLSHKARAYRHDMTDAAWQAEESARRSAQQLGQGAARLGGRARRTIVDTFTEEPLILGAVVVAIGAAIGASLPSSQAEDQLMGDARDSLRDEALDRGKDLLDKAKNVATETYRSANEEVDRQGLKPTGESTTIAQKLSDVVKTAAETAKTEAQKEGLV